MLTTRLAAIALVACGAGCAELHNVSYGEIEAGRGRPFEIMVSETGVNVGEAASMARSLNGTSGGRQGSSAEDIISLFQTGPKTGNPVFNDTYADRLHEDLTRACPTMRIHHLIVTRETQKYPVISGEIVKIKGECLLGHRGALGGLVKPSVATSHQLFQPPLSARSRKARAGLTIEVVRCPGRCRGWGRP